MLTKQVFDVQSCNAHCCVRKTQLMLCIKLTKTFDGNVDITRKDMVEYRELTEEFKKIAASTELITEKDREGFTLEAWQADERSDNFIYGQL